MLKHNKNAPFNFDAGISFKARSIFNFNLDNLELYVNIQDRTQKKAEVNFHTLYKRLFEIEDKNIAYIAPWSSLEMEIIFLFKRRSRAL